MIISVASGKGGTGKTTISTNLALSLDKHIKLLDCDVEEPNAHLFIKPRIEKKKPYIPLFPRLIRKNATGAKSVRISAGSTHLPSSVKK